MANEQEEELRQAVVKARVLSGSHLDDVMASNVARGIDEAERIFTTQGAIEPPYSPLTLVNLFEMSNSLRQNVDAYATNIDGFGHHFEPVLDFEADDTDERLVQIIVEERLQRLEDPNIPAALSFQPPEPTPDEVQKKKAELVELMRVEKMRLDRLFNFICEDMSFVTLRRRLRQDLEQIGNAYLEVLRDHEGRIRELVYIPAFTMRLMPIDQAPTEVEVRQKVTDISYDIFQKHKHFRRFVQVFESKIIFFKEFGDPRAISKRTGRIHQSMEDLRVHDQSDGASTEVLHFKIHSSRTAYGVPRWVGQLLSVLGSRMAEEVNYTYFDNKSVPPMALLVSGGRIAPEAAKTLETFIANEIRGKKNFHKILVIEAESSGSGGTLDHSGGVKVELKPLTDAQNKDGLFQAYDERNIDKVGMAFRLPRLLRGDIRDFNRATAQAALEFAEQQVFAPEREEFDWIINRKLFNDLGVRFWKFKSNNASLNDPEKLAVAIKDLVLANILTPEEARELCELIFNKPFKKIDAPWTKQPVPLTLAGISPVTGEPIPFTGEDAGDLAVGETEASYGDLAASGQEVAPPQITRTALGSVITVNEARQAHGLPPKTLPDGTPDPHGDLTITEYMERSKSPPPATQKDDGAAATPNNQTGDMTIADLLRDGGLALAQGARMRPGPRKKPAPRGAGAPATLADQAKGLLALRDALREAESGEVVKAFLIAKRAMAPDGQLVPPETLRKALSLAEMQRVGMA